MSTARQRTRAAKAQNIRGEYEKTYFCNFVGSDLCHRGIRTKGEVEFERWREDAELLDSVIHLTEFPSVLLGNFDPEFLELPEEVLAQIE